MSVFPSQKGSNAVMQSIFFPHLNSLFLTDLAFCPEATNSRNHFMGRKTYFLWDWPLEMVFLNGPADGSRPVVWLIPLCEIKSLPGHYFCPDSGARRLLSPREKKNFPSAATGKAETQIIVSILSIQDHLWIWTIFGPKSNRTLLL